MKAKFNVFEGARRIVTITMAMVAAIGAWFTIYPGVSSAAFIKFESGYKPALVEKCPIYSVSESVYGRESPVEGVFLTGCFVGVLLGPNNRDLRVAALTDPRLMGHLRSDIEKLRSKGVWDARKENLQIIGIFLISIYALSTIVGWIVRGFLSIPRGKDSRE
ncbi:hypothetical protein DUD43_07270 [Alcaligenes faecalis]|uniref:hypothetical protein n=1 Tax=Alcaligenes faecalis TaxID=511 RepID=UPI001292E1F3|nr:hypothetical protein [Alcaligenes faecalis]QFY77501.1 hypothetical protein DUD43_07270 [Alcaligenes faecalis]